jgi:hypothetical protein
MSCPKPIFPNTKPVWFVHEGSTLYLLPVQGSDINWYKNLLEGPMLKISVNDVKIPARGKPMTDSNRVDMSYGNSGLNMAKGK